MSTITVASMNTAIPYQGTATSLQLRILAGTSFITSAGTVVPAAPNVYKTVTCTIAAGIVTIPAFTIDSTTDSLTNQNARYSIAALYESATATTPVWVMLDNFSVSATYASTTWATLINQRQASQGRRPEGSYTVSQTDTLINSRLANYYTQTEIDAFLDDVVDISDYAVEITEDSSGSVNHGMVHLPDTLYETCFFEIKIKPTSTGYFYSSGYGGSHTLLYGLAGDSTNGYTLTGNFFNTDLAVNVSFSTLDTIRHNEWAHVALAYDDANSRIVCLINGVPSSVTAYSDGRYVPDITDTVAWIGGSDHNKMGGRIAGWRLFEGKLPYANPHNTTVRPAVENMNMAKVWNGTELISAKVVADYTKRTLQDFSGNGYNGFFSEATNQADTLSGEGGAYQLNAGINRVPANYPVWVSDPFTYTGAASPATPPVGAVIFDSFGRADIHKGNYTSGSTSSYVFNLGTTEVGSKTWSGSTSYGILNGKAYANQTSPGVAYVTDSSVNRTVKLSKPNTSFPTGFSMVYKLVFNYTDANNYNFLYVDESGTGYVFQRVAGSDTAIVGGFTFGTGWTSMSVTITGGNSCEVFRDTTSIITRTLTENLAATSKGFELNHPLQRVDSFTVS